MLKPRASVCTTMPVPWLEPPVFRRLSVLHQMVLRTCSASGSTPGTGFKGGIAPRIHGCLLRVGSAGFGVLVGSRTGVGDGAGVAVGSGVGASGICQDCDHGIGVAVLTGVAVSVSSK